ncbi:MAG TPA: AMP-binding protein [Pseudonocardiaceae bacterium]|nr:AMP-binding protein [Pseudonocardiaceae bacterium]
MEAVLAGSAPERLIVFDYEPEDDDQKDRFESACWRLAGAGSAVVVDTLSAVLDRGKALPPVPLHVPDADDNPMLSLFYTSGSTGTPKGAMYAERMLAFVWLSASEALMQSEVPMISLSYLPMSHLAGHQSLVGTLASGGTNLLCCQKRSVDTIRRHHPGAAHGAKPGAAGVRDDLWALPARTVPAHVGWRGFRHC